MTAPLVSEATSQCCASVMSRARAYSERVPHQLRVLYAIAVVGEQVYAGGGQLAERRQRGTLAIHGDAAGRVYVAQPGPPRLGAHELDDRQRVLRRLGVRHRNDRGESAEGRGAAPGLDRLRFFSAGLAEMHVQVDEAGRDDAAGGIERDIAIQGRRRLRRPAVLDRNVGAAFAALVEHRSTTDHRFGSSTPPCEGRRRIRASWNSTAIRTATPLVTWSRIAEPGSSAGSTTISTPRFIGPGCITNACGGRHAARCAVRPYIDEYSRRLGSSASSIRSRCTRKQVQDVEIGEHGVEIVGDVDRPTVDATVGAASAERPA